MDWIPFMSSNIFAPGTTDLVFCALVIANLVQVLVYTGLLHPSKTSLFLGHCSQLSSSRSHCIAHS